MICFVILIINIFLLSFLLIQLSTTFNTILNLPNTLLELEAHRCAVFDFRGLMCQCQWAQGGQQWSVLPEQLCDHWVVGQEQPGGWWGCSAVSPVVSCFPWPLLAPCACKGRWVPFPSGLFNALPPLSHAHNEWGFFRVLRFPGSVKQKGTVVTSVQRECSKRLILSCFLCLCQERRKGFFPLSYLQQFITLLKTMIFFFFFKFFLERKNN